MKDFGIPSVTITRPVVVAADLFDEGDGQVYYTKCILKDSEVDRIAQRVVELLKEQAS